MTDQSWLVNDSYTNPTPLKPVSPVSQAEILNAPYPETKNNSPDFKEWDIMIPYGSFSGTSDIYLKINYTGDRAEIYNHSILSADNFNDNKTWSIGLLRQQYSVEGRKLRLIIHPLSHDTRIFFDVPPAENDYNTAKISDFKIVPEYRFIIE